VRSSDLSAVDVTPCPHRPPCAACPRFGESGIPAVAKDVLSDLARSHGLGEVAVVSGSISQFRCRARLAIRGRVGSPKIGIFAPDSHRVVHIPNCVIHHPLVNHVASVTRRIIAELGVSCYSEGAHLGLARYLQVVVERSSQTAQVVLVGNSREAKPLEACLESMRERLGADLHSLWFNSNTERSNAILGANFEHRCGSLSVIEHFGGEAVHYPPGAFGQSNLEVAQQLIAHVRSLVPEGARVAEFYAGVGAIGLSLLDRVAALALNEVAPQSLLGLEMGLAALEPLARAKVTVLAGPAGSRSANASDAEVVIADPPRKGLDAELLNVLREKPPARFIYVSCGLDSLLEDQTILTSLGRLKLVGLSAFDLMPYTEHVETVAVFERAIG
jgi:tRNA/tmRNA/rRNA uracil-C5-methylase (TrmA/RlmC/RlmD family)